MSPSPTWSDRFLDAQLHGERAEAVQVLTLALDDGLHGPEVLEIVAAAQRRIGELWLNNQISIAREHAATAIAQLAMAQIYPRLPRAKLNGKCVALACVPGEHHEMGLRLVSDYLEMGGFTVRLLGADVPLEHLLHYLDDTPVDGIGLSAFLSFNLPMLRTAIDRIRERFGHDLVIAAGGPAFSYNPGIEDELDLDVFARDGASAVNGLKQALLVQ